MQKYLKYLFETERTIVFYEYYFFTNPNNPLYFHKNLLYHFFFGKRIIILKKHNEMKPIRNIRKHGIKNIKLIENYELE